jgi:hypothetical protein
MTRHSREVGWLGLTKPVARRCALAAAFGLLVVGPTLGWPEEANDLPIGSRVRICTHASKPNDWCERIGTLQGVDGDGLRVLDASSATPRQFPRDSISRLEVSLRRGQKLRGASIGFLIGAVAGVLVPLVSAPDSGSFGPSAADVAPIIGAFGGAVGAALGAWAGEGEKWRTVPLGPAARGESPCAGRYGPLRVSIGGGQGFLGPGSRVEDAMLESDARLAHGGSRPATETLMLAVEGRLPGARGLSLRLQRAAGRIGYALAERPCSETGISLLGSDVCSSSGDYHATSYGLLLLLDRRRWQVGLGPSRHRYSANDLDLDGARTGLLTHGALRLSELRSGSRRRLTLDLVAQYNFTGRVETRLRVWDPVAKRQLTRPVPFSHGRIVLEAGLRL